MSEKKRIFLKVAFPLFLLSFLLGGCSGLEQSEQEKMRRQNAKGEFIYRNHDEFHYTMSPPLHQLRERYPWEESQVGNQLKITKEFFRCRGSHVNPPLAIKNETQAKNRLDCGGKERHSLPIRGEKEFIYPILTELLNYLQAKTGKKVVITCGHRCPAHNAYADDATFNQSSKHMIGAEVDFYIQGMEEKPEEIVKLLMNFYKETSAYRGKKEYEQFLRYEKSDTNVSTPPWYNKEILIKVYKKTEGRDFDNRHPYPYLSIQVRHDRELGEKVTYSWPKAFNGYMRY
jgi:hypothetical protein